MSSEKTPAQKRVKTHFLHEKRDYFQSTRGKKVRNGKRKAEDEIPRDSGGVRRKVTEEFNEHLQEVESETTQRLIRVRRLLMIWRSDLDLCSTSPVRKLRLLETQKEIKRLENEETLLVAKVPAQKVRERAEPYLSLLLADADGPPDVIAENPGDVTAGENSAGSSKQMTLGDIFPVAAPTMPSNLNYYMAVYREFQEDVLGERHVSIVKHDMCEKCNRLMVLTESGSLLVCEKCRSMRQHLDRTVHTMGYHEDLEISDGDYKKSGHFRDWLTKVQAKESTRLEESIIDSVREYLLKHNIVRDLGVVTRAQIHNSLRELYLNKCYDHVTQIWVRITGKVPKHFTQKQTEEFESMFTQIQGPWEKYKDFFSRKVRINMLSYQYCLYKFCQLRGYSEFLEDFILPKGADKLKYYEAVFQAICVDLKWQFVHANPHKSQLIQFV